MAYMNTWSGRNDMRYPRDVKSYVSESSVEFNHPWNIAVHMLCEALEDMCGDIGITHINHDGLHVMFSHTGPEGSRMHCVIYVRDNDSRMIRFTGTYRSICSTTIEISSYGETKSCIDYIIHSMGERKTI